MELATSLPEYIKTMEEDLDEDKGNNAESPLLGTVYLLKGQACFITLTNFMSEEFDEL